MSRSGPESRLKQAFLAAVLLHVAALLVLSRLPAARAGGGLDEVRVFGSEAPLAPTPVTLVTWGEEREAAPVRVAPPVVAPPAPPAPTPAPHRPAHVAPPAPVRAPRAGLPKATPMKARPAPPAGTPGGGGGGPIRLGSLSARGTLVVPTPEGHTGIGQTPGVGSGEGSGQGPGRGGGSGGGSGGGRGAGNGKGTGAGTPGGEPPKPVPALVPPRPKPRPLADRANPEVIAKGRLSYPESAAEDGVEGTVVLKVVVGTTGVVESVEVRASSGDRRLDRAAVDFVRTWRYRPAVQDGMPRRVMTEAKVKFELR